MATTEEYAQLALYVYNIAPSGILENRPHLPDGWELLEYQPDNSWGFSWGAFRRIGTDEVVVSYTGTNSGIDWVANVANGIGIGSSQTTEAALAYLSIKANYGSNISFTGHSLGGGLASIMAVWFDRQATTFDEAPFQLTAQSPWVIPATKLALYLAGFSDPAFTSYNGLTDFNAREENVTNYYVQGEILAALRLIGPTIVGSGADHVISANIAGMSLIGGSVSLHSQALLTAFRLSDDFRQATYVSDFVLPLLMDGDFYAYEAATSPNPNILVDFVRSEQELGSGNGKLSSYAETLNRIGTDADGLTEAAQKALIAQGMEWYYWQGSDWGGDSFFADSDGVLQYTIAIGEGIDGAQNKASKYVQSWLAPIANDHGEFYYARYSTYHQWTIAVSGATATADDTTKSQLFVGGDSGDTFTGGDLGDLMFAGDDADTLNGGDGDDDLYGGEGNDQLNGGNGYDRYRIEGQDTVDDEDGRGFLEDKSGNRIAGVVQKREDGTYVFLADETVTVTGGADLTLTLSDGTQVTIKNYEDGDLGIHLDEDGDDPETGRDITGDLKPVDFNPGADGVQTQNDDLGNVIVDPNQPDPGRQDYLQDSAGNDNVVAGEGFDIIDAWRGGDDILDAGAGNDIVVGRDGDDVIIGGAGEDLLRGDDGEDEIYAGEQVTVEEALAAQDGAGTGLKGDFVDGSNDDDVVVGDAGNDALNGGLGDDVIVAGPGNDDLDGDLETSIVTFGWSVVRTVTQEGNVTIYHSLYNNVDFDQPTDGGDDAIFGGGGDDWVRGGMGDDYIDGGADKDVLFGEAGNDEVIGGSGDDVVSGDSASTPASEHGDDYIDGGDGDDSVYGYGGHDALFGGEGNDLLIADTLNAEDGDDYADGEAGNDTIAGGGAADQLFGGEGDDEIFGDSGTGEGDGDDVLSGEEGDDLLIGEGGRDTISGGDGADQLNGDGGGATEGDGDELFGDAGNDTIVGDAGDDYIDAGTDDDLVDAGEGNDYVLGGDGQDQLQGADGDDALDGGAGIDTLFGEAGNDVLMGGDDTDFLLGGEGDDALDGGDGDDVYYYLMGEGNDSIADSGGTDWLVFQDIMWGQIGLNVGSLQLVLPGGGSIHLEDFNADNPYGAGGIEYFQFADNTVLSKANLINLLGIVPTGTPQDDTLTGTALGETVQALAGNDLVSARAGNDIVFAAEGNDEAFGGDGNDSLWGGAGNDNLIGDNGNDTLMGEAGSDLMSGGAGTDLMLGGEGDDLYFFAGGDGQDIARDAAGNDRVLLAGNLNLADIVFSRAGDDLVIAVKNSTDRLTVEDWFTAGTSFTGVILGDLTELDHAAVEAAMPNNQPPAALQDNVSVTEDGTLSAAGNALANDSDPEGHALRITNPGSYTGTHGSLTLQADGSFGYTLANGAAAVQSLAAGQSATDAFSYTVTDDDPAGAASASGQIVVTVHGANDAPVLAGDAGFAYEDDGSVDGNVLLNDHDIDTGTVLSISNAGTMDTEYGALTLGLNGDWSYSLDDAGPVQKLAEGQTVTETFAYLVSDGIVQVQGSLAITITGRNDAPELADDLDDQSARVGRSWTWQVPAGSFTDVDVADVLAYSATLADGSALPAWLSFDGDTGTFSGRVPRSASGSIDILVEATDGYGNSEVPSSASDIFTLTFVSGGGGGGGGGGGTGGNEGIGNGEDPPPPGHDYNFNDGPGTSPGDPGAEGGNGYVPPGHADLQRGLQDVQIGGAGVSLVGVGMELAFG